MRYDQMIYFVREGQREYHPESGDYADPQTTEEARMASVMDTREQTLQLIYGKLKQGSLTIHLQNHYSKPFDYILIKTGRHAGRYSVDWSRKLRTKNVFIVSEVQ